MSRAVRLLASCVVALAFATAASANNLSNARELTTMWEPKDVRIEGSSLIIVLPQRQITDTIYLAILTTGLCLGELFDKQITGLSEVQVLNEFSAQGYVYERGLESCAEYMSAPAGADSTKFSILANTHMY